MQVEINCWTIWPISRTPTLKLKEGWWWGIIKVPSKWTKDILQTNILISIGFSKECHTHKFQNVMWSEFQSLVWINRDGLRAFEVWGGVVKLPMQIACNACMFESSMDFVFSPIKTHGRVVKKYWELTYLCWRCWWWPPKGIVWDNSQQTCCRHIRDVQANARNNKSIVVPD